MRKMLNLQVNPASPKNVLEKIKKYSQSPSGMCHVVSLNPEIAIIAHKSGLFRKVISKAQIQIVDGIGIVLAGRLLGFELPSRLTGVDLMEELIKWASESRLPVMLIGGKGNLAKELADCYNSLYSKANITGLQGIRNIAKPTKKEESRLFSIVSATRPRILLVAFGSPHQELWIWRNRHKLKGIVCIGVGGAFDILAGRIRRAPVFMRKLGLEWLWRLARQPWRLRRQLRLVQFIYLIFRQRFGLSI